MRIRMLRNALGSPDGTNLYQYEAGTVYSASETVYDATPLPLSERLAALFVAEGWAEAADDTPKGRTSPAASPSQDKPNEPSEPAQEAQE